MHLANFVVVLRQLFPTQKREDQRRAFLKKKSRSRKSSLNKNKTHTTKLQMLTLDDDLKLVILEYHNYHLSISLEHSIDKTWNYFQSLIPQLTKHALQLIVDSQGVIRKNSISRLNEYTILEYLIKLWTPELDLNDVIDLVANLSSISPLNQDNVINGVERYEDLSRSLTIEEQVSAIFKKSYSNNDIYYLDEINFPVNGEMTTITFLGNLSGTDFLDPLVVTSSVTEAFNYYPTGLLNPYHLYIYLLRLNFQLQLQGRKILLVLHNNCWMNRFFTNIEILYISKQLDGYYYKDGMKFPGDYGLKNWLRQSLSHTDIIPNLLFNYNQLIQKLKSDPVMYKFNQLCIGKALDTVGNESLDNYPIRFDNGIFVVEGETRGDEFILDYHYSIKDVISIMLRLNNFEKFTPSLPNMDWDKVSDVFVNEIFPSIRNSDLYFKFSILYNELHMKNDQSAIDRLIQPPEVFSIPPDHVTLVDLICKIDDSFKRTVDKSHLLSTLHPEKSGPSLVSSKDEDTSASESEDESRKRPNDSEEEVRTIKKSKILQLLEKNDLHFVDAFEEDEDEESEESADGVDDLLNDSFAGKIKRSKYTPHTSANASIVNGTGSLSNNTPQSNTPVPKDSPVNNPNVPTTSVDNSHQTGKLGMLKSLIDLHPPTSTKPIASGFSFSLPKNTKLSRNFDGSDESSEESTSSITSDDGDQSETVTTTSRIDDIDSLEKRGASNQTQPSEPNVRRVSETSDAPNNNVSVNVNETQMGPEKEHEPLPEGKIEVHGEGEVEITEKTETEPEVNAEDKMEVESEQVESEDEVEADDESESESESESSSESESDSGSEYVDESSEISSFKNERRAIRNVRRPPAIISDSSASSGDEEVVDNPRAPVIDTDDSSSNSDEEVVNNPKASTKVSDDSSSNSDEEIASNLTKKSDDSSSGSDEEIFDKPQSPKRVSDQASSSSNQEIVDNPETATKISESSSSEEDIANNPETPTMDIDESSSSSDEEMASNTSKVSDGSASSNDEEVVDHAETPAMDIDESSSGSDEDVASDVTKVSDSSASSNDKEVANNPTKVSDGLASSNDEEIANNPETLTKVSEDSSSSSDEEASDSAVVSDGSSSGSDTESSTNPETPPKLNQKQPIANAGGDKNVSNKSEIMVAPLPIATPRVQGLALTPTASTRRAKMVLSKEFVLDSDDITEDEGSNANDGIEKDKDDVNLKSIPVKKANDPTVSMSEKVPQPDSKDSLSESSDDSESSESGSGSDSSESSDDSDSSESGSGSDSDSSDESMDSSDEESSESSSSDESPAVKKPELKTTGSKEKPQPVKVQKTPKPIASSIGEPKKVPVPAPAPAPKTTQRLASLKDLKHPRTTIEMKKPILLLPTKPKKKFSRIFDSSDDDSSESESDSDSEVPMSQLKVGRAPKRATQATKPPIKSDTSSSDDSSDDGSEGSSDDSSSGDSSSDSSSSDSSSSEESSSDESS